MSNAIDRLYDMIVKAEAMPAKDDAAAAPKVWVTALDPTPRTLNEHGVSAARRDLIERAAERARQRRTS